MPDATDEEILQLKELRLAVNQLENAQPWSDEFLLSVLRREGSVDAAAVTVWEAKAASVAHLVDISEGGSSRKMSTLHQNYLSMADRYRSQVSVLVEDIVSAPRTRRIERA